MFASSCDGQSGSLKARLIVGSQSGILESLANCWTALANGSTALGNAGSQLQASNQGYIGRSSMGTINDTACRRTPPDIIANPWTLSIVAF